MLHLLNIWFDSAQVGGAGSGVTPPSWTFCSEAVLHSICSILDDDVSLKPLYTSKTVILNSSKHFFGYYDRFVLSVHCLFSAFFLNVCTNKPDLKLVLSVTWHWKNILFTQFYITDSTQNRSSSEEESLFSKVRGRESFVLEQTWLWKVQRSTLTSNNSLKNWNCDKYYTF